MNRDAIQKFVKQGNPGQRTDFPGFGGIPNGKGLSALIVFQDTYGRCVDSQQMKCHQTANREGLIL